MSDNPFKKLKKIKVEREKAEPARKAPSPEPPPPDEEDAFFKAMSGVTPLDGKEKIASTKKPPAPRSPAEDDSASTLEKLVNGELDFELEYTDEYMHGHVRGLDSKIFRRLKAGTYAVETHLDMHGMTMDQAYDSLLFFLREAYLSGNRTVLLIPGRGLGSPMGRGVLKRELQTWLTREPLKRVVLAYCTAQPSHGGAGALYVLLRRKRKGQGKVNFDRAGFFGEEW
ncbi:Smr/MutS family protein [Desulfohalovibrio reitneri]|uniref:Smr/MutS family protein n=1 Tax=Desulfohalovibrio reitneri TaxID=1307759 RepID=UPI0004A6DD0D|nr:Smr/MutS family protein [Desulfohalovibrio reitneri]